MNLAQLQKSRAMWRKRESSRYAKWHFYRYSSKRSESERNKLRDKWWKLYQEARDNRIRRDRQIADAQGVPPQAIPLIAGFEGFSPTIYRDAVGVRTQGYGDTSGLTEKPWTKAFAQARLRARLAKDYYPTIKALNLPTSNMRAAFLSFIYNCGVGAVGPNTTVGRLLRARQWHAAADAMLAWDKGGGKRLPGLTRRRQAEHHLALS